MREMRGRFRSFKDALFQLVVEDDAFGLDVPSQTPLSFNAEGGTGHLFPSLLANIWVPRFPGDLPPVPGERQVWRFKTNTEKLDGFRRWVQDQVDRKILTTDKGKPWTSKYVESAYKKGRTRAFIDSRKGLDKQSDFFAGTKAQFLRSAFNQPELLRKVEILATRSFEDLRGISSTMGSQINRALANGLLRGENPRTIARNMAKNIDGLSKNRAMTIARTEIIHAHAEGQLDSFEELGVEEVGIYAEWSTAGDDKVCEQCAALEGAIMTVQEARGLIPRHPNCRCAWIPATDVKVKNRRRKTLRKIKKSVEEGNANWAGGTLLPAEQRKATE